MENFIPTQWLKSLEAFEAKPRTHPHDAAVIQPLAIQVVERVAMVVQAALGRRQAALIRRAEGLWVGHAQRVGVAAAAAAAAAGWRRCRTPAAA